LWSRVFMAKSAGKLDKKPINTLLKKRGLLILL